MNQDLFYFDISNHSSNDPHLSTSEIFNDINYDILNNLNYQSPSQYFNPFSFNNIQSFNSLNKFKNENEMELDEEKEIKEIKINNINNNTIINNNYFCQINNIDNNNYIINNNINSNKCKCQCHCLKYNQLLPVNSNDNNYNQILKYEDYFLNNPSFNYENNIANYNKDNSNYLNVNYIDIHENSKSNNISFNLSNNIKNNNDNNNKDELETNNLNNLINIDLSPNNAINKSDNEKLNENLNNNDNKKTLKRNSTKKTSNKNFIGVKRKDKKRKKENKIEQIIKYGHPQKNIYKTIKQKLNIHKKLDPECRKDTFLLIYTISKIKNMIKDVESKGNIKDKINFTRIKDLYIKSILSLEHREYAQGITGFKLI